MKGFMPAKNEFRSTIEKGTEGRKLEFTKGPLSGLLFLCALHIKRKRYGKNNRLRFAKRVLELD
jgi:hypothetical protein